MTSKVAVALATIIHILMRVSIFVEQPAYNCSPAPTAASWMFLLSILCLILDADLYPERYANTSNTFQVFAEFVMSLLLIEFGAIVIWCRLEKTIFKLIKCILMESTSNMYYDMGGDGLVGFLIIMLSFFILINVAMATDYYYNGKRRCLQFYKKCCERTKRAVNRDCSNCENDCITPMTEDSDGLYCPPTVQTRRRSYQVPSRSNIQRRW